MNKELLLKRNAFVKTFVLGNLSERMPDNQLKTVLGGYDAYSEGNTGNCCVWGNSDLGNGQIFLYCMCGVAEKYVQQIYDDLINDSFRGKCCDCDVSSCQ